MHRVKLQPALGLDIDRRRVIEGSERRLLRTIRRFGPTNKGTDRKQ
jgi:hypothetical protein